jgi:hypothetical protein
MLRTLKRGLPRIMLMAALGVISLQATIDYPTTLGSIGTPVAMGLGLTLLGMAVGDLALRIIQPDVDSQKAAEEALRDHNTGAGLVYLGRCILMAMVLMLMVTSSRAAEPPAAAVPLLPTLKAEQVKHWPGLEYGSLLGAQVEQETCITLKHRSCWNPRAELKTSREQGVGLGQLTRSFRGNGSTRFDALTEITQSFPKELQGLDWQNRYDPALQLRALVLKDRQTRQMVLGAFNSWEALAMTMAAYNGGSGGLRSDRAACSGTTGCDKRRWFGHVERTSLKAKLAVPGYGKSFFAINREYVTNIMLVRRARYLHLDPS